MIRWIRSKLRKHKPQPWSYVSHEYRGIADGTHVYLVSYQRGEDRETAVHRFHARHSTPQHDEKMAAHFRDIAARKA